MKVILLQDVWKVGKKGEIVNVSDGYGSNYLIPRKLAILSNDKNKDALEREKKKTEADLEKQKLAAMELAKKLEDVELTFELKPGTQGRANGSISKKEIEEELFKKYGYKIDKRKFVDKRVLDCFGYVTLQIELFKNVIGNIKVHIKEKSV